MLGAEPAAPGCTCQGGAAVMHVEELRRAAAFMFDQAVGKICIGK